MRSRLCMGLIVFNALLLAATLVLWARSYWRLDDLSYRAVRASGPRQTAGWDLNVISSKGGIGVGWSYHTRSHNDDQTWRRTLETAVIGWQHHSRRATAYPRWSLGQSGWRRFGFQWNAYSLDWPQWQVEQRQAVVPYWLPFVVVAVWPALRLRRLPLRRWRERRGACRACGYDLRGSPERCPECGTVAVLGITS